ncbi:heparinase II/III family protein [uncultured Sphaerochaeta sp.]|uniref:heparinase II/III family protein n=1 Tax=uncultured Sphaerochaeta sp. TaxID=886478 RepID=UPI002A0A1F4A|nr:heparinase II/III family protein [uncultured Sphaerochaeta sp.]
MKPEQFYNQGKVYFFDDKVLVADYVRIHEPDEVEKIIVLANEAVNHSFRFALRWDMERTVVPVHFEGAINWLYQPGDDSEWVYAFNRMRFWICLGQAYALTGNEMYAKAFAEQLCHWVKQVKKEDPLCAKAWRSIEAGLRLEYWTKAMLYFKGSPHITEQVVDTFLSSVTEHAEFLMGVWDSYHLMSNWGVLENHGLFIASVILPTSARTLEYQAEAIRRLALESEIQVYDDGMQWEQSPMYHNEVTHDFLDVLILARRNGIALPPAFILKTHAMCKASFTWQKPDGNEPCMGDSDEIDQRDILTKGAYLFADPLLKGRALEHFDFDTIWDLGLAAQQEYERMPSTKDPDSLGVLKNSGNAYVRRGESYIHFHCGTMGAGHGHSDQLHIDLFANGEDILVDAGRFTYVAKAERFEFKDSTAHNTTTVDNENFTVCKDSWECSKLTCPVNFDYNQKQGYQFVQGGHLGYLHKGVFVNRKLIVLQDDLLLLCDEFYTKGKHSYQQYLHCNDAGFVSKVGSNFRYRSDFNDVEFCLLSPDGASGIIPTRVSRHYNECKDNKTIVTKITQEGFASLFTVISINKPNVFSPLVVKKVPVRSNFKGIVFPDYQIEAVTLFKGDSSYTVAVAHQEWASPTDTFLADGCTGFGNVVVFDRTKQEKEIGTCLHA